MNESVNIFSIKTISFVQGELDPFGFDDFSEKLGAEYLPFTGSVSKPSYFLFVAYLNHILDKQSIPWKNKKERREIETRLEKLLVYCWKIKAKDEKISLRSNSVIGNSFELNDIDLFSGKGWVKQNALRIYNDKNFAPKAFQLYFKRIGDKQTPILNRFISADFKIPGFDKKKFTDKLLKDLQSSEYSLFNNHQLNEKLKQQFKAELFEKIKDKKKNEYLKFIERIFGYKSFKEDSFWKQTLEKPKLPFTYLNDWFGKFVLAVDADVYNKPNKELLWNNAKNAFKRIEPKFISVAKSRINLIEKQKPKIWFQLKENTYSFIEGASKGEKNKIEGQWDSYKKRQGEEIGTRYFFNFRHYALMRLLKELQS